MHKLLAVEEARRLFNEAKDWSIWRWLLEKKRVRTTADAATAALDEADKKVKAGWSDELKKAYRELEAEAAIDGDRRAKRQYEKAREEAKDIDEAIKVLARKVREADEKAEQVRLQAEDTFALADRRVSSSLAREGAGKALLTYDLREKAIRRAEAAAREERQSTG
jgi:hypothetical protein